MTTINDLKLTIEFFEWLCKLTYYSLIYRYNYKLIKMCADLPKPNEDFYEYKVASFCVSFFSGWAYVSFLTDSKNKDRMESLIYQAIDGLNDLFLLHRNEPGYYEIIQTSEIIIIQKPMIYSCVIPKHDIIYNDYENKTTARLAALQWIFNQGVKDDKD